MANIIQVVSQIGAGVIDWCADQVFNIFHARHHEPIFAHFCAKAKDLILFAARWIRQKYQ
jgi:hypothetical protein